MKAAIAESNRRLEIPGAARIVEGNGGLSKVRVTSARAEGEIYLHGAHLLEAGGQRRSIFCQLRIAMGGWPGDPGRHSYLFSVVRCQGAGARFRAHEGVADRVDRPRGRCGPSQHVYRKQRR